MKTKDELKNDHHDNVTIILNNILQYDDYQYDLYGYYPMPSQIFIKLFYNNIDSHFLDMWKKYFKKNIKIIFKNEQFFQIYFNLFCHMSAYNLLYRFEMYYSLPYVEGEINNILSYISEIKYPEAKDILCKIYKDKLKIDSFSSGFLKAKTTYRR